jgi:sugar phosphate permease
MDVSSELIHSLLPVFMVVSLGASALTVGLIEGAAEATALIVKVFSGVISDWWGRRKPLAVLGYGLGALSKPLFALATGVGLVVAALLMDRVGKGIRGAPRDALVADSIDVKSRGLAFGVHRAADTAGAVLGLLLALVVVWAGQSTAVTLTASTFQRMVLVSLLPAGLAVGVLIFGARDVPVARARRRRRRRRPFRQGWGAVAGR